MKNAVLFSVGGALDSHVQQEVTSCCHLVKIVRRDGFTFAMTDHDYSIKFNDGVLYRADVSYNKFNIADHADFQDSNSQIDIPIDGIVFTRTDFLARRWDGATVTVYLVNWADLTMGAYIMGFGSLGTFKVNDNVASVDYRGLSYAMRQTGGDTVQPECRADFGSAIGGLPLASSGCGFNLNGTEISGAVSTTDGRLTIVDPTIIGANTPGFQYAGGLLTFKTGLNSGLSLEYRSVDFTTGTITFEMKTFLPIAVGDTYSFTPSCDKTIAQCIVYENAINFQGEPYAPQPDAVLSYPDYVYPHG